MKTKTNYSLLYFDENSILLAMFSLVFGLWQPITVGIWFMKLLLDYVCYASFMKTPAIHTSQDSLVRLQCQLVTLDAFITRSQVNWRALIWRELVCSWVICGVSL